MILATALLMAAVQPAQPAEPPRVERREMVTRGPVLLIPRPILPAVALYQDCLDLKLHGMDLTDAVAAFESGITQCAETRAAAMVEADRLLRAEPGRSSRQRRRESIERSFDGVDESHRDHARQLTAMIARSSGSGSSPAPSPAGTVTRRQQFNTLDVPTALMPAFIPYMRCLAASSGIVQHWNGRVLPPPADVSPGDDCLDYRRRSVKAAHSVLRGQQVRSRARRTAIIEAALAQIKGPPGPGRGGGELRGKR